ncbi:MAG: ferritin [Bacteroidia bacterium]|nr:ferritin [Bacteroidia bacterium]MDW8235458.1 ferritin [Bacteroidia bacterium]
MTDDLKKTLSEQFQREFHASYLYLGMAAYALHKELKGFGRFFLKQSEEEREHAMRLFHYLLDRDILLHPLPIEAPTVDFPSILECFRRAYAYEQSISQSYYNLLEKARGWKDADLEEFVWWYIREQREEEATMRSWVERLTLAGNDGAAILLLDRQAGKEAEEE